jgi:hypothetical protein
MAHGTWVKTRGGPRAPLLPGSLWPRVASEPDPGGEPGLGTAGHVSAPESALARGRGSGATMGHVAAPDAAPAGGQVRAW